MVLFSNSRREFYYTVVFKATNQSRWAGMVPKVEEDKPADKEPEPWDAEVSAREMFIPKES